MVGGSGVAQASDGNEAMSSPAQVLGELGVVDMCVLVKVASACCARVRGVDGVRPGCRRGPRASVDLIAQSACQSASLVLVMVGPFSGVVDGAGPAWWWRARQMETQRRRVRW